MGVIRRRDIDVAGIARAEYKAQNLPWEKDGLAAQFRLLAKQRRENAALRRLGTVQPQRQAVIH